MSQELVKWSDHLAAIKEEGVSMSSYAKRHQLPVNRLYYWQSKTHIAATPVQVKAPNAFIALKVSNPATVPTGCTLMLSCGMRLEMAVLPSPDWLIALQRCVQGAN